MVKVVLVLAFFLLALNPLQSSPVPEEYNSVLANGSSEQPLSDLPPLFKYNVSSIGNATAIYQIQSPVVEIRQNSKLTTNTATVYGFRIEEVDRGVSFEDGGVSSIQAGKSASIRLYGEHLTQSTAIRFVTEKRDRNTDCDDLQSTKQFTLTDTGSTTAWTTIQLPPLNDGEEVYYLCVRETNGLDLPWIHQGTESWLQIKTYEPALPLWVQIIFIVILLSLSGLFSGLNLGLMSLDRTELKIIAATGTDKERAYAKSIQPLRKRGNYLLCTLLLGNVLVNNSLTILIDGLSSGLVAVIASTIAIVVLGEIVPQAICSRHGLAVGANTVWLTKIFMLLTFPASFPISLILDKILGEEIGNVYNRERLKELIRVTDDYNDLEKDEVNIIAGALELKQKVVADVMTKLEDVFMLPSDAVLDFDTVSEIMSQGYSRVPIYEGTKKNLISVLYTKDLAFVDPDDKMPLRSICEFYSNPIMYVFETTTLDILFRDFKTGNKGHMAFAQKVNEEGEKEADPYYEITGLVTMEDVIEALIQSEINDETDVYDSIRRRRSKAQLAMALAQPLTAGLRFGYSNIHVSPQLVLAAFQYLSTSVEEFSSTKISKPILQRLLSQNLFFQIKVKTHEVNTHGDKVAIYEKGKPADYFVLILEGRVQVEMGKENLHFESGPFTYFGAQLLNLAQADVTGDEIKKLGSGNSTSMENLLNAAMIPDYTVRPLMDTTFLRISRSMYHTAKQATVFGKTLGHGDLGSDKEIGDHFQTQLDQMFSAEGENQSNRNFLRRKSSLKHVRGGDGISKSVSNRDPDILVSNQNTFPQSTERTTKRNSELLSEILLTPRHLLENDKTSGRQQRKSSAFSGNLDSGSTDRNVTFEGDNKRIDPPGEVKKDDDNKDDSSSAL